MKNFHEEKLEEPIKFESATLYISVIYETEKSPLLDMLIGYAEDQFYTTIQTISTTGNWQGTQTYLCLNPHIKNKFWNTNIDKIVLYDYYKTLDYYVTTVAYFLKTEDLDRLLDNTDRVSRDKENLIKELIIETFPDVSYFEENINRLKEAGRIHLKELDITNYRRLVTTENYNKIVSPNGISRNGVIPFLNLQPQKENIPNLDSKEDIIEFAQKFEKSRGTIGLSWSTCVPYRGYDYLETIHMYNYLIANCRVILSLRYIETPDHLETILVGLKDTIHLSNVIAILERVNINVLNTFSGVSSIEEYIEGINSKHSFTKYAKSYTADRKKYIKYKLRIEARISEYKDFFYDSIPFFISKNYELWVLKELRHIDSDTYYDWSHVESNNIKFNRLIKNIETSTHDVVEKDTYISEFLRDSLTIRSIRENINLQRSILVLTCLAVVLTISSIFASVFSEELKVFIKDLINNYQS